MNTIIETIPAVWPNSQFTLNCVNITSQHEHLVMLIEDTCHSEYAARMIGQTEVQYILFVEMLELGNFRDPPKIRHQDKYSHNDKK